MQARVIELVCGATKKPTGYVIKVAHTDLGHRFINSVWLSMEREWQVSSAASLVGHSKQKTS